jgi:hypothetical protein
MNPYDNVCGWIFFPNFVMDRQEAIQAIPWVNGMAHVYCIDNEGLILMNELFHHGFQVENLLYM